MSGLVLLTPSYRRDFELFSDLRRSIRRHAPDVTHVAVVDSVDVELFSQFEDDRCLVWSVDELLPGSFIPIPRANVWLNLRRPYPPVRGWIAQQIVKLVAASRLIADAVLLVDSDVVLVRDIGPEMFVRCGEVRFYRADNAVHAAMLKHVEWHRTARRLLGLPEDVQPPLPDYISSFATWDPRVVRAIRKRVETTTGRSWTEAIAAQLHFSEWILYGVFVDAVLGGSGFASDSSLCHSHWEPSPLDVTTGSAFLSQLRSDDVAVLIQSKSNTPLNVRREVLAELDGDGDSP